MEFDSSSWIRDGVYYYPHLFGGIMLTAALLGLSTSYFGGTFVPAMPYNFSELGLFHRKKYGKKRVRVYMDGCFDLMHYGHANALRQAKALGDELVVGVISDEEIIANKGPPVLSMEERLVLVSGLKWVDEVIANAPYEITEEFMNRLFNEHNIDYIIHGDDPCLLPDGTDAYALAKKAGRYKQIKRTEGVSSTDIVGRILGSMKDTKVSDDNNKSTLGGESDKMNKIQGQKSLSTGCHLSHFLPTSRRIVQFSNGKAPGPNARVVYIDGAFDLFHAGHVEILKSARQLGDFLLVGIYTDQTVSERRGSDYPLMHLHERSLSVLGCRYVDEVIIGAPREITNDMITTFNISLVVHGTVAESNSILNGEKDPYEVPKSMGIFRMLESPKTITAASVAQRIIANHDLYMPDKTPRTITSKSVDEVVNIQADDVMIRDPLRKKVKGQQTGRLKSCLEKTKRGRKRKIGSNKEENYEKLVPCVSSDQLILPSIEQTPVVSNSMDWDAFLLANEVAHPPNGFLDLPTQENPTPPSQFSARRLDFTK